MCVYLWFNNSNDPDIYFPTNEALFYWSLFSPWQWPVKTGFSWLHISTIEAESAFAALQIATSRLNSRRTFSPVQTCSRASVQACDCAGMQLQLTCAWYDWFCPVRLSKTTWQFIFFSSKQKDGAVHLFHKMKLNNWFT